MDGIDLHAQPTHLRNTTSTGPPRPHTILLSLSSGASSPTCGSLPTGIGGGGGVSHGWTEMGSPFTDIHSGQDQSSSSAAVARLLGRFDVKVSEEMPTFLRASFVARLENMF